MQITVFGASGKVGVLVVAEALRRGYTVVAFVHSRDPFPPQNGLVVQMGDIHNSLDVAVALRGSDAVVSCLGSWGTKHKDVLASAMRTIVPAMDEWGIVRVVTLTGIGVQANPSAPHKRLVRLLLPTPIGKIFYDAEEHLRLLGISKLVWTAICSPVMNNIGGAGYKLSTKMGFPPVTVSRASVATALLDQVAAADYLRQTPTIHRKK